MKLFMSVASLLAFAQMATANSGDILMNGSVQQVTTLEVTDSEAGVDFANLGAEAVANKIVGSLVIDSNSPNGFSLTVTSLNGGTLAMVDGSGKDSQVISYNINLSSAGGTLGDAITEPGLTSLDLSTPQNLSFAGSFTSPTLDRAYNVGVDIGVKALQAGSYQDTVTVEISAL